MFRAFQAHPTINDELPQRIMVGAVQVRPHVASFTPTGVYFTDGTYEHIDDVVMATGYDHKYTFIEESVVKIKKNERSFHRLFSHHDFHAERMLDFFRRTDSRRRSPRRSKVP